MTYIFVIAGQSNANGVAKHKPGYVDPAWLSYDQPIPNQAMGADNTFARAIHAATLQDVRLIKVAANGTSITNEWAPGTGYLYRDLVDAVARSPGPINGALWMQGEADWQMAASYYSALDNFVRCLRADTQGALDNVPLAIGQISDAGAQHHYPSRVAATRAVMAAEAAFASADPAAYLLKTSGYGSSIHMSEAGYAKLGLDWAKASIDGLGRAYLQTGDVTITRNSTIQLFDTGNNHVVDKAAYTRTMAGEGNDIVTVTGRFGYVWGESGNDRITTKFTSTHVDGGAGNDVLTIQSSGTLASDGVVDVERVLVAGRATVDASALSHGQTFALLSTAKMAAGLIGTAFDDVVTGGVGVDTIQGGEGNDWIIGGAGRNTLYGDGGHDTFMFTVKPEPRAYDRIIDFDVNADTLAFSHTVFKGDPVDHAAYNPANGGLYWDGKLVATLGPGHDPAQLHYLIV